MPCGALAVQTAQLQANVVQELLLSATIRQAFAEWLEAWLGVTFDVSAVEGTYVYASSTRYAGSTQASVQIIVRESGVIAYGLEGTGRSIATIEEFLTALARIAAQQRLVDAIGAEARITLDQQTGDGMRILQLEV